MKKILFYLVFSAVLNACVFSFGNFKNVIGDAKRNVVYVYNMNQANETNAMGTGFFSGEEGTIITNLHVVSGADKVMIKTPDGTSYQLDKVVNSDDDSDIFIFTVHGIGQVIGGLHMDGRKHEIGDEIMVVGNPMGLEQTVSTGIISGIREIEEYGYVYQITAPISSGSSGSPVLDSEGKVIGVATFQFVSGQNLNFVIPSEKIIPLMYRSADLTLDAWKKRGFAILPSSSAGLTNLGQRYYHNKEYEKALKAAFLTIKTYGKYPRAYRLAALAYIRMGNNAKAEQYAKYAIMLDPKLYDGHGTLGFIYELSGKNKQAKQAYLVEMEYYPENYESYTGMANIYGKEKNPDMAVKYLEKGIKMVPRAAPLYAKLAEIYKDKKQYTKALMEYKNALSLDPSNPNIYYDLGCLYVLLNERTSADEIYENLNKQYPSLAAKLKEKMRR